MMLPENKEQGWYWVQTKMYHRTPFKKWVIVELVYEPDFIEMGIEPYCWIDANSDEFDGHIIAVGPRIPNIEEKPDASK